MNTIPTKAAIHLATTTNPAPAPMTLLPSGDATNSLAGGTTNFSAANAAGKNGRGQSQAEPNYPACGVCNDLRANFDADVAETGGPVMRPVRSSLTCMDPSMLSAPGQRSSAESGAASSLAGFQGKGVKRGSLPRPADAMSRHLAADSGSKRAAQVGRLNVRIDIMNKNDGPLGQANASSAGIVELLASAENSSNGIQNTASRVPGNNEMCFGADESDFSVFDLLGQDGEISPDDLQRLEECFREELNILAPEDELIAGTIAGDRVYCTVVREDVSMTQSAFTLRLSVVWFDRFGGALTFDALRLPLSAPDSAAASRLIDEMVGQYITPLAQKLAELYGPRLDARVQVKIETEANA